MQIDNCIVAAGQQRPDSPPPRTHTAPHAGQAKYFTQKWFTCHEYQNVQCNEGTFTAYCRAKCGTWNWIMISPSGNRRGRADSRLWTFFSGASSPSSGGGVKKLRPSEDGAGGGVSGAVVLYIVPRAG